MYISFQYTTDPFALCSQHQSRHGCSSVMEANLFEKYEAVVHRKLQQFSMCVCVCVCVS